MLFGAWFVEGADTAKCAERWSRAQWSGVEWNGKEGCGVVWMWCGGGACSVVVKVCYGAVVRHYSRLK